MDKIRFFQPKFGECIEIDQLDNSKMFEWLKVIIFSLKKTSDILKGIF